MTIKGSQMAFSRSRDYLSARLYSDGHGWFYMSNYQQRVYLTPYEMEFRVRADRVLGSKTRVRVQARRGYA